MTAEHVYSSFSGNRAASETACKNSETLRAWLEWYPEKILFGTDSYPDPNAPLSDWEE